MTDNLTAGAMRPMLRRSDASAYLMRAHGISRTPGTLAKLATIGGGPQFVKFGHVPMYSCEALDQWVRSKTSAPVCSTSELPNRRAAA